MGKEEKGQVFRKKSLERIASPEQLSDYLHVTNPEVWVIFAAIIIFFIAFFAWATLGNLESTIEAQASIKDGVAVMALPDTETDLDAGMSVHIGGEEYTVSSVQENDEGYIMVYVPVTLPNGIYDAVIIRESITPIRFLLGM